MKLSLFIPFISLLLAGGISAQEVGKVSIRNGANDYPPFIISMNGIRLSNTYAATADFDYLDEYNYRVKLLQAGSAKPLSFVINSAPKYISKYILTRTTAGDYELVLESKTLMGSQPAQSSTPVPNQSTVVISNPSNTVVVYNGPQTMSDEDYQGVLQAIKKESFENGKLDLAKTFFSTPSQLVTSEQVLGVLKLFSFENNRLSFAKFAYAHTQDKQNYYKVYDVFSFSNSKKELSEYIKKNP